MIQSKYVFEKIYNWIGHPWVPMGCLPYLRPWAGLGQRSKNHGSSLLGPAQPIRASDKYRSPIWALSSIKKISLSKKKSFNHCMQQLLSRFGVILRNAWFLWNFCLRNQSACVIVLGNLCTATGRKFLDSCCTKKNYISEEQESWISSIKKAHWQVSHIIVAG